MERKRGGIDSLPVGRAGVGHGYRLEAYATLGWKPRCLLDFTAQQLQMLAQGFSPGSGNQRNSP